MIEALVKADIISAVYYRFPSDTVSREAGE